TGFEELGRPFEYQVDVLSTNASISAKDIVGSPISVNLELKNSQTRFFNGIVAALEYRGFAGPLAKCRLYVRPWFWFLSKTKNSRVFLKKGVVDIIREVLDDFNLTGVVDFTNLKGTYAPKEFVVQYDESAFNFISRLMENEGIYYFFRHEAGGHKMV